MTSCKIKYQTEAELATSKKALAYKWKEDLRKQDIKLEEALNKVRDERDTTEIIRDEKDILQAKYDKVLEEVKLI